MSSKPKQTIIPLIELNERHTAIAVMAEGKRKNIATYLRQVADSIDDGCISGFTGDTHPVLGKWFGMR